MAKTKKQPEAEKQQEEQTVRPGYVLITGTGVGGLVEGKDYQSPEKSAEHLVNIGHATLKTK